jgi:hypothetical protein
MLWGVKTGELKLPVSNKPNRPAEWRLENKDILAFAYHLSFRKFPKKEGGRGEPPKENRKHI